MASPIAQQQRAPASGSGSGSGSGDPNPGDPGDGDDPRAAEQRRRQEFAANYGEAVAVLREDLPEMFARDLRWHIFRDDVVCRLAPLSSAAAAAAAGGAAAGAGGGLGLGGLGGGGGSGLGGAALTGIGKYKWLHRGARALAWLLYSDVRVASLRMWEGQADRRQLRVRWCAVARPRRLLPFTRPPPSAAAASAATHGSGDDDDTVRFEAVSTYRFDSSGRISEHWIDRVVPPEAPLARWLEALFALQGAAAAPGRRVAGVPGVPGGGVPQPVPGGGGGGWREQL